jgi:hypothetical protein
MKTPHEQAKLAAVRLTWLAVTTGLALIALAIFWAKTQNAKEVTEVTPTEPTVTVPRESLSVLTAKLNALSAKRDVLLKNFVQTGDKFKHPKIYSHIKKNGSHEFANGSLFLLSATADGFLHIERSDMLSFNANGELFRIRFKRTTDEYLYRGRAISPSDIADGYIAKDTLDAQDKVIFKGLREFCAFLASDQGKSLKYIEVKHHSASVSSNAHRIEDEKLDALRNTIELFVVLEEIEKISKEIRAR